jgi:hypothetical protein
VKGLNALEQAVLDKLLAGDHPALATLRTQAAVGRVASRENTGVGFFCDFRVPSNAPRLQGDFHLGDVDGQLNGLEHGAGFVLFVREGCLELLEGFSYDEPWPEEITSFTLAYRSGQRQLPPGIRRLRSGDSGDSDRE